MSVLLLVHIAAGSVALFAGGAALAVPKGERLHRWFGTVFFLSMLGMAGFGAWIAAFLPQRGTAAIGLFTLYLVLTSWLTVRRPENATGLMERLAAILGLVAASMLLAFGIQGTLSANGRVDSLPAAVHYPFAAIGFLAVALDLSVIRRGGISGNARIARHLWRMCLALLIAAFSFFLGQQKVMPPELRGSPLLFLPEVAILAVMMFWLVRLRTWRSHAAPRAAS